MGSGADGRVLVVNTGSSSLKYRLVDTATEQGLAHGVVERLGSGAGTDHESALSGVLASLSADGLLDSLLAVGHRVVHGGPDLREPVVVDDAVEAAIADVVPLAPLHNPAALTGIRVMRALLPDVPQVAVFDTAFHATIPPEAHTYAIPPDLARAHRIRRYGFHGTSVQYVTRAAARLLGRPHDAVDLIVCHLGNGASVTAVRDGRSIDTSMGLTPLAGLVMGSRSGDIDPAVVAYLVREAGMSVDDVDRLLTTGSGLKGLTGEPDMREVRALARAGDASAVLALAVYSHRVRAYIGAYLTGLPGLHALVFTGGIGENDAQLRHDVCRQLDHLGLRIDDTRNATASAAARAIDDGAGRTRILVVPTDEEAEIARQAVEAVAGAT